MKRIFLPILAALLFVLGSQSAGAQFRYGVIAGPNYNSLKFKQEIVTHKSLPGAQAGVQAELMFPGIGFGLDFGLLYNLTGNKVNLGEKPIWSTQGYGDEKLFIHNLQIPLHLKFKWTRMNGFEDTMAPFVYFGPEFNIQLAHSKCDAIKFSGGDLGLTVGVGVELFKRWQLAGSYTWGMSYALKTQLLDNYSARPRQWSVKLLYFFK